MNLHAYFLLPDALTVAELRDRIGAKSDAQIRQWQHGYAARRPSPENCLSIERVTNGVVTRQDLRPADFWLIWPDLPEPGSVQDGRVAFKAATVIATARETDQAMAEAFKAGVIKDRRDPASPGRRATDITAAALMTHAALTARCATGNAEQGVKNA